MENITAKKVVINYNKELLDSIDNKCQKKHKILDTIVTIAAIPIFLYLGYYCVYHIINKNAPTELAKMSRLFLSIFYIRSTFLRNKEVTFLLFTCAGCPYIFGNLKFDQYVF